VPRVPLGETLTRPSPASGALPTKKSGCASIQDDDRREEEFRKELKSAVSFLQPGETLALTLHDGHAKRDLGGQFNRIVQG